jgi:hypothetical protein
MGEETSCAMANAENNSPTIQSAAPNRRAYGVSNGAMIIRPIMSTKHTAMSTHSRFIVSPRSPVPRR